MIKRILDKTLLFGIGTFLVLRQGVTTDLVAIWLSFLAIVALGLYFDSKPAAIVLMLLYGALCLWLPPLLLFLPVICYDALWYRCLWCYAYALLAIPRWDSYPAWVWLIAALGMLASGLLSYGTRQGQMLAQELIRLRDTATERDMMQQARARELLEKQDYEVYLATLKERNRIAREIHDNVGHMLSRSILQVGALGTIYKEEPLHGQLLGVNETLNEAMTSIRRSVHDLHDEAIDLEQAVRDSVRDMQEKYRVTIEYDMSRHVPREVKYCFIAIVKEAVSNIVKHSDADTVTLRFREHPALYQMVIEDNGTVSGGEGEGIGLGNMRERVQTLGGTLHIQRENGFHIFAAIQKKEDKA